MTIRTTALAVCFLLAGCGLADGSSSLFARRSPGETGIRFANTLAEDDSVYNALDFDYMYNGGGVAAGDLDGDGRLDLFFAGNMVSSRLYLNRGKLRFDDVTDAAGVGTRAWVTGVTMVDIDQDGRLDIYLCVAGPTPGAPRANLLFVNQGVDRDGVPHFVERAKEYGIADTSYSTQAAFFDYDRDGDLDLYLLTNAREAFNRNTIRPKMVHGEAASTDHLYRNEGNGTFTDVSRQAGITIEGYGLGVVVSDLNDDGWPDVYVANDFVSNDLLWINDRDGTFTNRAGQYLKHQTWNGMGADVADYDGDGRPDVVVVDMLPPDNRRQKTMLQGGDYDRFRLALSLGYEPQYTRNTLQLNDGPGSDGEPRFSEVGQLAGIAETDWSWAPLFADFDNDGRKDLFISNGYRRDVTDLDHVALREAVSAGPDAARRRKLVAGMRMLPGIELPNYVFRNEGNLGFSDRTKSWGLDVASYSNGAVYADLDADGDLDLVVNNIDGPAFVFENRAERLRDRGWLRFALRGPAGNRGGYGTKVTLVAGGTRQYLELEPTRGYLSSVEPFLHFGLGAAARADTVRVRWPDDRCQQLTNVAAKQVVVLDHASATACAPAPPPRDERLFRAVALPDGLPARHEAREVPELKVTPLLPHEFSKGGPALAVGDVDGDGREDVYVGADRGQEKAIYLQTRAGRFEKRVIPGASELRDMGALLFDADGDGDLDLFVASGGTYVAADAVAERSRVYVNDGRGRFTLAEGALPGVATSASSVVAADYDADGDLDLFVGGRVVPGQYPLPPRSWLLRNDGRRGEPPRFTDVTDAAAPGLARVGMVNGALWTDFDGDGRVDLAVVGEWMPLTFFRNEGGGRLANVTASTKLGATEGWWNGIVGGDFDDDGDVDYMVGNLGLNTRYRASEKEPVEVYAGDFDGNGTLDPVMTHYVAGKRYPVASRDQMIAQVPGMRGRFRTYADFGDATLEKTLSREERERAHVARSVTFASAWVENRGGGSFALHALPLRAQVAPVFGMLAGDWDADGKLDVLLAGNSYAEDPQSGWADASVGALLRGDGKGGFSFVNGTASGFLVEGDAKAAAELVLDEQRSLLLVTQHGDSLRAFVPLRAGATRRVKVEPLDARATFTFAGGRTRRQELYYGSTYLSQSSRWLAIPDGVTRVTIQDFAGRNREIGLVALGN